MKCLPFNGKKLSFEDNLRYQWHNNKDRWCSFNDQPSYVEYNKVLMWENGYSKFRGFNKPSKINFETDEIQFYDKDEVRYIPDNIHSDYLDKGFFVSYTSDGYLYEV